MTTQKKKDSMVWSLLWPPSLKSTEIYLLFILKKKNVYHKNVPRRMSIEVWKSLTKIPSLEKTQILFVLKRSYGS